MVVIYEPVDETSTRQLRKEVTKMTNTDLLKAKIESSGYKLKYIAAKIGLSYQGFLNKINNKTEFTAPEIKGLCDLLEISIEEKEPILFASDVDK